MRSVRQPLDNINNSNNGGHNTNSLKHRYYAAAAGAASYANSHAHRSSLPPPLPPQQQQPPPLQFPLAHDTLPTMTLPSSSSTSRRHSSTIRTSSSSTTTSVATLVGLVVTALCLVAALGVTAGYYYFDKKLAQKELALMIDLHHAQTVQRELSKKVHDLETLNKRLSRERAASRVMTEEHEEEKTSWHKKVQELVHYKRRMHLAIQELSKTRLLEKFGPGPHRFELKLAFPRESNIYHDRGGDRIYLELAPEDYLPHTVYWFCEQVDRQLWDGACFHRNANHVIQSGPTTNFLTPPDTHPLEKFKESGFSSVLFQEYSHNFPHVKYTLGFAGRPGGPDFYINIANNAISHGPGGQSKFNDPDDADPCFAKVIAGFAAVDRLHRAEVERGSYNRMKQYVAIEYIRPWPRHQPVPPVP